MALLTDSASGLYCAAGNFHIDPWSPVPRAVLTHAHSDHARRGCGRYLVAREGEAIFRLRLGSEAQFDAVEFGETRTLGGVQVSLHPAGHMTGSAQVRVAYRGETWVVSGDYKLHTDPTTRNFEPLACHTFITESTFGLPIYRWESPSRTIEQIHEWWRGNQQAGRASVLLAYSIGKAQRLLAALDEAIGPIFAHGAIVNACEAYAACGVRLPAVRSIQTQEKGFPWHQTLILAPPSAQRTPWMRRFGSVATGMASGWMRIRGMRRWRAVDRGFVISDHADWPGLLQAIHATGASQVYATHGHTGPIVRYLRHLGLDAHSLQTRFRGELDGSEEDDASDADGAVPQAAAKSWQQGAEPEWSELDGGVGTVPGEPPVERPT